MKLTTLIKSNFKKLKDSKVVSDFKPYFQYSKTDFIKATAGALTAGSLGFLATENPAYFVFSSAFYYMVDSAIGPSLNAQKDFFGKYINKNEFPNFKPPKKLFSKSSIFSSLFFMGLSSIAILRAKDYSFSELANSISKDSVRLSSGLLFQLFASSFAGYAFGDFLSYAISNHKDILFNVKHYFKNDKPFIKEIARKGDLSALVSTTNDLFKKGELDSALSLFFNSYYRPVKRKDYLVFGLDISKAMYLEKYASKQELLTFSLIKKFPKPFIDGLVEEVIKEAKENNDPSTLALCSFYLEKNNASSKNTWQDLGKLLHYSSDSLEDKLIISASSKIKSLNFSKHEDDLIKDLVVLKKLNYSPDIDSKLNDELNINNLAYDLHFDDSELEIPLILSKYVNGDSGSLLMRFANSDSIYNFINDLDTLDIFISRWLAQSKKISDVYLKAKDSGLVKFDVVDYTSRIKNQEHFFGKYFDLNLAHKLNDRLNFNRYYRDSLVPGIDNHPAQYLFNKDTLSFVRVDFGNNGSRPSIEYAVNSSLWFHDAIPKDLIKIIANKTISSFAQKQNIDFDIAVSYYLDAHFERRNHLLTRLQSHSNSNILLGNLLAISHSLTTNLSSYVNDKNYVSKQLDQTESFYRALKSKNLL